MKFVKKPIKLPSLNLLGLAVITASASFLMACTSTLSHDITQEGHVDASNLVWPELDDAWQDQGQFPNSENLSKIKAGIDKDELYQLIGRPHFSETQHAREWDYIMKFYQADNSVKICQYKVIFDKDYRGQEFYWLPNDCPPAKPQTNIQPKQIVPQQIIVQSNAKVVHKKMTLDADALFAFDEYNLRNMLPQGRAKLDELANKLRAYEQEGDVRIHLTGHTDRKGSEDYNMTLSQNRANTVMAYLAQRGINPANMSASGIGEGFPVVQCSPSLPEPQEIACLQPNRRVEVDVVIHNYAVK